MYKAKYYEDRTLAGERRSRLAEVQGSALRARQAHKYSLFGQNWGGKVGGILMSVFRRIDKQLLGFERLNYLGLDWTYRRYLPV